MKYACNTWMYGSFPCWLPSYPLEEVITRIAKLGYDGIEIGCAAPHAWPAYLTPQKRKAIRSRLVDENLTPVSLLPAPGGGPGHNPASPSLEERNATVDHYKEVIDLAHELGAGLVLYIGGWQIFGVTREEAWKWSVECLRSIAEHASQAGIIIAAEPTAADSNVIEGADDALQLMRATGKDNVKVMFDTFHALYRNEVAADYVRAMGKDLVHVHAADVDRLPPGDGTIDWPGLIRALREQNFAGYMTMEIGFSSRSVEPDRFAQRAINFLKQVEAGNEKDFPR
jgi:sugar phosphate isomerase/epimerase